MRLVPGTLAAGRDRLNRAFGAGSLFMYFFDTVLYSTLGYFLKEAQWIHSYISCILHLGLVCMVTADDHGLSSLVRFIGQISGYKRASSFPLFLSFLPTSRISLCELSYKWLSLGGLWLFFFFKYFANLFCLLVPSLASEERLSDTLPSSRDTCETLFVRLS